MKKFALSVVAALLITAASAGVASAQETVSGAQATTTSNIWY